MRSATEHKSPVPHHPSTPRGRKTCNPRQPKDILRRNIDERMHWLVIDIPCCTTPVRREPSQSIEVEDAYSDDDIIIDKSGLRRLSNCPTPTTVDSDSQSRFALADTQWPSNPLDDDCVSQASTKVGDAPMFGRYHPQGITNKRTVKLESLQKKEQIGRGSSGVVWRALDLSNCGSNASFYAVKEMVLDADDMKRQIVVDELRTSFRVHHPSIVTCHEIFYTKGIFSLVMEHMDAGSLLDALKAAAAQGDRRGLPCAALACVGRGVAEALAYLHDEERTMHRDVKPSNILLSRSGAVKLGDLGICTRPGEITSPLPQDCGSGGVAASCDDGENMPRAAKQWIGTVTYMSPERIFGETYSFNADVWSLGVVLAEAGMCRYPYALPSNAAAGAGSGAAAGDVNAGGGAGGGGRLQFWDLLDMVVAGPCPSIALAAELPASGDGRARQDAVDFVAQCLTKDLHTRPPARDCLGHPFLSALAEPEAAAAARASLVLWLSQASSRPSSAETGDYASRAAVGSGSGARLSGEHARAMAASGQPPLLGGAGAAAPAAKQAAPAEAENVLVGWFHKVFVGGVQGAS